MFTTAPLFGRFHSPFKKTLPSLRGQPLHHLESLCADRIAPALLAPNDTERERIFTPRLTFLTFLDQVLNPGSSCRNALDQIKTYYQSLPAPPPIDNSTSGYCQARARWTTAELVDIRCHLAKRLALHGDTLLAGLAVSRPLKVIDGLALTCPTPRPIARSAPSRRISYPVAAFPWSGWWASSASKPAPCWRKLPRPIRPAKTPCSRTCGPPSRRTIFCWPTAISAPMAPWPDCDNRAWTVCLSSTPAASVISARAGGWGPGTGWSRGPSPKSSPPT